MRGQERTTAPEPHVSKHASTFTPLKDFPSRTQNPSILFLESSKEKEEQDFVGKSFVVHSGEEAARVETRINYSFSEGQNTVQNGTAKVSETKVRWAIEETRWKKEETSGREDLEKPKEKQQEEQMMKKSPQLILLKVGLKNLLEKLVCRMFREHGR